MENVKYAPVIIPTLCRYEHFRMCIESLKKNPWAKYTDMYIGLDYPAKEEHWDGYNKICEYLDTGDFSVFKSFSVTRREKNYGPAGNFNPLLKNVMEKFDRWIYVEDDLEFSPNFLEYIDKCLTEYEDDDNIIAVNGYSFPLDWVSVKGANVIIQSSVCKAWGVGYWRNKYKTLENFLDQGYLIKNFDKNFKIGKIKNMDHANQCLYINAALGGRKESLLTRLSDLSIGTYMQVDNKFVVTPTVNKVRNHGFDGSGNYCSEIIKTNNKNSLSYDYDNQNIDASTHFDLKPDSFMYRDENRKLIEDFWGMHFRDRFIAKILFTMYKILGVKKYKKIMKKMSVFFRKMNIKYLSNISYDYLEEYKGD